MTELKPCPFCGGEATVLQYPDGYDNFTPCCKDKKCLGFYIGYIGEGLYKTKEKAIEEWNRRADDE